MKNKLLIIGASGHGKVVADVAMKMNRWESIAFLDDNPNVKSSLGLRVIGTSENIPDYIDGYDMFVGIGNNKIRKKILKKLEEIGATIPVLVHPSAVIGEDVIIDKGTVIMAGAIINPSTSIGKGCIINTGSTIDHDNNIGDFVHISPGVNLAGTVNIGSESWLGIGSIVSNNVNVTERTTVGAGALVLKDILVAGVYSGVPAKKIK